MKNSRLLGVFEDEEVFESAVQMLTDSHIEIEELYAPVPVHKAVRNVTGKSRLPTLAYFLGIMSMLAILSFLYYTAVIDWPLNIGGKPSNAFPSFIIITLVLTILSVTILSLLAFSLRAKLYPGKKEIVVDERAMNDKFIIVLDPHKVTEAESKLKNSGAEEVIQYNGQNE
jgi:hypothetical protein